MAISNANATKINHMNRAAHNISMGTVIQDLQSGSSTLNGFIRASGSFTAGAPEAAGSVVTVLTGLTGIKGYLVDCYKSGSLMTGIVVVNSGSNLLMTAGSHVSATPKAFASGDIVNWIVW